MSTSLPTGFDPHRSVAIVLLDGRKLVSDHGEQLVLNDKDMIWAVCSGIRYALPRSSVLFLAEMP